MPAFNMPQPKSAETLRRELANLKNRQWEVEDFPKLVEAMRGIIPFFPFPPTVNYAKDKILYRARLNRPDFAAFEDSITQLEARKDEDIKNLGRAHFPGQSIFYSSTKLDTAISETVRWHVDDYDTAINGNHNISDYIQKFSSLDKGPSSLDNPEFEEYYNIYNFYYYYFVTVSQWRVKEPIKTITIIDVTKVKANPRLVEILKSNEAQLNSGNANAPKMIEYIRFLVNFFADEFSRIDIFEQKDYLLTAAITHQIFTYTNSNVGKGIFDGITYSSVANNFDGENLALFPHCLHKLEFLKAQNVMVYNKKRSWEKKMLGFTMTEQGRKDKLDSLIGFDIFPISESTSFSEQTKEIFWANGKR